MNKLVISASILALSISAAFAQNDDVIVVTGQKIDRTLQDTPTSVAVTTEADIKDKNLIDLTDVFDQTANIATQRGSRFKIRGIDSVNVSGGGQSDLATIYVDGSPLPRNATRGGALDVWDLEQVEIFRGPQSTLQGRASLAGAVILKTADPTYEWTGKARITAGTGIEERRIAGAIGGPIIEDQLAFRVAAELSDTKGVIKNQNVGGYEDEADSQFFRGKLLIEPESLPDLRVLLSYTYDDRTDGDFFSSLTGRNPEENRVSFTKPKREINTKTQIAVANLEYDISDEYAIKSITTFNEVKIDQVGDGDRTAVDREFFETRITTETVSQELQLIIDKDRFQGVIGGYYSTEETPDYFFESTLGLDLEQSFRLSSLLQAPPFNLPANVATTVSALYPNPTLITSKAVNPYEIETRAIFSDFSYELTDELTLYGGFRYDQEEQLVTTGNIVTLNSTLPDPAAVPAPLAPVIAGVNRFLLARAQAANSQPVETKSPKFNAFLPKLGLGYDIDDDRSVSFTVQKGYRSGGVGINPARARAFEFDQEFIWNYELAFRTQWFDDALTVNSNIFYIDWSDQQVNVQLSDNAFDSETQNAGSSNVRGFEIESKYEVNANLDVYGSVGYSKTKFEEFVARIGGADVDFSGNEFGFAPRWTLAAGATYRGDDGFFLNVNGNYNSAAFASSSAPQVKRIVDARTLVNFKAGWDKGNYGIYLTGNNLLDEEYVQSSFPVNFADPSASNPRFARFGDPRSISIQLEADF